MSATSLALQIVAKFDTKTFERKMSKARNDLTRWTTIILFNYLSYADERDRPIREVLPAGYTVEAALSDIETMNCLKSLLFIRNGCVLYTRRHLFDGVPTRYRQLVLKIPPFEEEMPELVPFEGTAPPRAVQSARVYDHDNRVSELFPNDDNMSAISYQSESEPRVPQPFFLNQTIWNPNDIWIGRG
jgi:hypothetical protein